MLIYIGGVNGVGKSTILEAVERSDSRFKTLKGSTLLMESLGIKGGDYTDLRSHSNTVKNKAFGDIVSKYSRRYDDKSKYLLLDAHYLNLVKGCTYHVIGSWIQNVHGLILLKAPFNSVLQRISKDELIRDRGLVKEEGLSIPPMEDVYAEYMRQTQEEFETIFHKYNLPSLVISNEDDLVEVVVEKISKFCLNI